VSGFDLRVPPIHRAGGCNISLALGIDGDDLDAPVAAARSAARAHTPTMRVKVLFTRWFAADSAVVD